MEWLWLLLLLPIAFFIVGCGGCACCTVFEDLFNRGDSTNLGADWTEDAGDWSILGNELKITTANARLLATTTYASGYARVSVSVKSSASADLVRILLNYVDSSNYYFAQLKIGTGAALSAKIQVGKKVAGVETILNSRNTTLASATYGTFVGCINSALDLFASIDGSPVAYKGMAAPTGTQFGLATGGTVTGTVNFDNFSASKADDATCPLCTATTDCSTCTNNNGPYEFQVDVAAITIVTCASCASLAGTYILQWQNFGAGSDCTWHKTFASAICQRGSIDLTLSDVGGGTPYQMQAVIGSGDPKSCQATKNQAAKYDCYNLSALNLGTVTGSTDCAYALATMKVTSVP